MAHRIIVSPIKMFSGSTIKQFVNPKKEQSKKPNNASITRKPSMKINYEAKREKILKEKGWVN